MSRSSTSSFALVLGVALSLAACGGDDTGDDPDGGPGSADADISVADAGPQYSDGDWLFEADRLLAEDINQFVESYIR